MCPPCRIIDRAGVFIDKIRLSVEAIKPSAKPFV